MHVSIVRKKKTKQLSNKLHKSRAIIAVNSSFAAVDCCRSPDHHLNLNEQVWLSGYCQEACDRFKKQTLGTSGGRVTPAYPPTTTTTKRKHEQGYPSKQNTDSGKLEKRREKSDPWPEIHNHFYPIDPRCFRSSVSVGNQRLYSCLWTT